MTETLVCFHAHPDDEALSTGGIMAEAAALGHRVVLVLATRGEHGEPVEGVLEPGERLGDRRAVEVQHAADILGVSRVEFLGYVDSGMMGEPTNDAPECFWQADVEEAARRLAAILEAVDATVLTVYDANGVYGHPDHIQVHRVGHRAAALAATPRVYEATINRDHVARMIEQAREQGATDFDDAPDPDDETFGVAEAELTTIVDVTAYVAQKRAAIAAHASQVPSDHFFLAMAEDVFAEVMGTEWFIRADASPEGIETSLWPDGAAPGTAP